MVWVWRRDWERVVAGGISMAAVAVATALHQETAVRECGRLCEGQMSGVPSSLVWVSVPASGSASSSAPGSLNGLSLQEGEKSRNTRCPFIQYTNKGRRMHSQTGDEAANVDVYATIQLHQNVKRLAVIGKERHKTYSSQHIRLKDGRFSAPGWWIIVVKRLASYHNRRKQVSAEIIHEKIDNSNTGCVTPPPL